MPALLLITLLAAAPPPASALRPLAPELSPQVLDRALTAYARAQALGVARREVLAVIDYSRPSTERRLWVFDLAHGTLLFHELVAHGRGSGGNLASLNLPQMVSTICATTCTFTRTLHSTSVLSQNYTLGVAGLPASAVTVTPPTFTVAAGATQTIQVTIDGSQLPSGWNYGQLALVADDVTLPALHMPIAINP